MIYLHLLKYMWCFDNYWACENRVHFFLLCSSLGLPWACPWSPFDDWWGLVCSHRLLRETVCKVSVLNWNTISQTLGNSGLDHGKVIYLVLVSACSYVYGCTYIWRQKENLPGTSIRLFFRQSFPLARTVTSCLRQPASLRDPLVCACLVLAVTPGIISVCPCATPYLPLFSLSYTSQRLNSGPYALMFLYCELSCCPSTQMIEFNCYFFVMLLMCVGSLSGAALCSGSHTCWPSGPFPFLLLFFPLGVFVQTWGLWKACVFRKKHNFLNSER